MAKKILEFSPNDTLEGFLSNYCYITEAAYLAGVTEGALRQLVKKGVIDTYDLKPFLGRTYYLKSQCKAYKAQNK